MNSKRFNRFREESDVLIHSQNWLANEMDKLIDEYNNLPSQPSESMEVESDLALRMEFLELRAQWEERESDRFNQKYNDILDA